MKALVTGACGFVGPFLIQKLVEQGYDVIGTYFAKPKISLNSVRYEKLDVCNLEACSNVISTYKPQKIFHLAGIAFVPEAESSFEKTLSSNVLGVYNLVRVCHLLEMPTNFLFASSAEVYGQFDCLPIVESMTPKPQGAYSLSKLFAEQVVEQYHRKGIVKGVIARPFNHIGPGQDSRFVASSFARQLAEINLGLKPAQIQVGNLLAKRDFCDVRDVVNGYISAIDRSGEIFNFSSGTAVTIESILDTLIEISGLSVEVQQDSSRMRPAEVPEIRGSFKKANIELNWTPQYSLKDSLSDIYNYWVDALT